MMNGIFVWTIEDVITASIVSITAVGWVVVWTNNWWIHRRCKHDGGVNETSACDAICRKCGKNLGFIDNWRKPSSDTEKS